MEHKLKLRTEYFYRLKALGKTTNIGAYIGPDFTDDGFAIIGSFSAEIFAIWCAALNEENLEFEKV